MITTLNIVFVVVQRLKDDVKDAKDSKLSDPFYDSLEGLLSDLKAVTVVCGAAAFLFFLVVSLI